ncbi:hypothetical protein RDWZM_008304 [Blomia tropicalis]|uniref:Uncharacterized protein n=1 Tax=Blomia tropicalis TaxID=40697 RepID=A0A9Q0M1H7_BLOTA|nr:hypothetical protein RDWZM_008304 [Blomia tropicalis]
MLLLFSVRSFVRFVFVYDVISSCGGTWCVCGTIRGTRKATNGSNVVTYLLFEALPHLIVMVITYKCTCTEKCHDDNGNGKVVLLSIMMILLLRSIYDGILAKNGNVHHDKHIREIESIKGTSSIDRSRPLWQ